MNDVAITGIGTYLPARMLSNDDLPPLDKPMTDAQIARLGVYRRGWAGEGEGIAEMGAEAGRRALAKAALDPKSVDLIVLANWTQRRFIPEFAPKLQRLLGAPQAVAFDVCTACTGFVYGVAIAHGFMQTDRYANALVVASETTSKRGRPASKSTLIFGDAAGAFVLEKGTKSGGRLVDYEIATDGEHYEAMEINDAGHVRTSLPQKELNQLAASSFAKASRSILERNGLTLDDVDWVVPHSGTAGIQATLIRTLGVAPEKVFSNFNRVGNVSSAAIPVAFEELVTSRRAKPGQLILSPTTGTGWYYGAMLYTV